VSYGALGALLFSALLGLPSGSERFFGLTAIGWVAFSWVSAALHQGWVALFWRAELYGQKVSARFGPRGFLLYRIGFIVFAGGRMLPLIIIAALTERSLSIPTVPRFVLLGVITLGTVCGLYSVVRYFGVKRAFGADHFDHAFRELGLERRGIYRWVPNAMYAVVLLGLYIPGLAWQSASALIAAAAHHLFVWVHYFCTEKPDMKAIYG
jgi:hypothetical protein